MIKMSHTVAAAALVTMSVFGGAALADSHPDSAKVIVDDKRSQVTVVGEGSLSSAPDVMRLNTGVEVRRDSAKVALADARRAAARLTRALVDAGVEAKDLRTDELSLGPEYADYPRVSGYRAVQGVEAVVREIGAVDRVIDAVAGIGEDARLNGVSFEVSSSRKLLKAARDAAFKDAMARAEQYARLSGRDLGPILSISEEGVTSPHPIMFEAGAVSDKASISPGRQTVSVSVRVVYELR
ncbi:SIMPL domain-containing protein [Streptosporangium sp. NPDC000396]|uniref:SIMPL domain-containing protein n=1 Tax=Streptosporangium sp. NPDC000396 TaxID=3366185 RepID=UPI0036C582D8